MKQEKNEKIMQNKNNDFRNFIQETVIIDKNSDNIIQIETLFERFKIWYSINNKLEKTYHTKRPKQKELKTFMRQEYSEFWDNLQPYKKRGYKGLKFIDLQ